MEPAEEENVKNGHEKNIENRPSFTLTVDLINMHITASNETAVASEMPMVNDNENVFIAPEQGETPVYLLHYGTCEELAFACLFPRGKLDAILAKIYQ